MKASIAPSSVAALFDGHTTPDIKTIKCAVKLYCIYLKVDAAIAMLSVVSGLSAHPLKASLKNEPQEIDNG